MTLSFWMDEEREAERSGEGTWQREFPGRIERGWSFEPEKAKISALFGRSEMRRCDWLSTDDVELFRGVVCRPIWR